MYASLHTHTESRFDTAYTPEQLVSRLCEMKAAGIAVTEHGVVSSIDDLYSVAKEKGLKLVYGVEAYVSDTDKKERRHLVLLAKNTQGRKAIDKAVTKSFANMSDDYPLMNADILKECFGPGTVGHGNVFATSACMQGVLAAEYLQNNRINKNIRELQEKLPEMPAGESAEKYGKAVEEAKRNYDETRKMSQKKYAARLKKIQSAEKKGKDVSQERLVLEKEIEETERAKTLLPSLKQILSDAEAEYKVIKKEINKIMAAQNKYKATIEKIETLKSCLKSEEERYKDTKRLAVEYRDIFGDGNFYIELQNHRIPEEITVMPVLAKLAVEIDIPVVATNDVHMPSGSDDDILKRSIAKSMRFNKWEEPSDGDKELYFKTDSELKNILCEIIPENIVDTAISNIRVIFDVCEAYAPIYEEHYPKAHIGGEAPEKVLELKCREAIKTKFDGKWTEEYENRLQRELKIICSMGYADYHLIVADFLEYARIIGHAPADMIKNAPLDKDEARKWVEENDWTVGLGVGCGRGSAVGSLACNLLGITAIDPLPYDLLFERFLNPERVSMPDIDSDFAKEVRERSLDYVKNVYGENAVCCIQTKAYQAPKGAVRACARFYGAKTQGDTTAFLSLGDSIAKDIPKTVGMKFNSICAVRKGMKTYTDPKTAGLKSFDEIPEGYQAITLMDSLKEKYKASPDAIEILRWAGLIENTFTQYGVHAAGVVISDNNDVSDYIPLKYNTKAEQWTTQCDMVQVEGKGLLKMDFLGLKNLNVISDTLRFVKETSGREIDMYRDCKFEPEVFSKIFCEAQTNAVFQFESSGMKKMLKEFKPDCFEDLIILVSMFRPGPLQFLPDVIAVKNGRKKPSYITPQLEEILGKTYGAIVYQEQVMQICQFLAGYSLGQADNVRKYMSKKKADKLAGERKSFIFGDPERNIKGCMANGITEKAASTLFDQMTDFAKYAFNKSHATAYAMTAYYTGWLKYHYPAEYFAAAMTWAKDMKEISRLVKEARAFDIKVLPPSINLSEFNFSVDSNSIVFGLSAIKGLGNNVLPIIEERHEHGRYPTLASFIERTNIKRGLIEKLAKAGAFDCFSKQRKGIIEAAATILPHIEKIKSKEKELASGFVNIEKEQKIKEDIVQERKLAESEFIPEYTKQSNTERLSEEKEMLGAYISASPLDNYPTPKELGVTPISDSDEETTEIMGVITDIEIKVVKKTGREMAFFTVEDQTDSIQVCAFSNEYARLSSKIKEGKVCKFYGKVEVEYDETTEDEQKKFFVRDMNLVPEHLPSLLLYINTFDEYKENAALIDSYKNEDGRDVLVYNKQKCRWYQLPFKLSELILYSNLDIKEERY